MLDAVRPLAERFAAAGRRLYLVGGRRPRPARRRRQVVRTDEDDLDLTTDADAGRGQGASWGRWRRPCGPRASGSARSAARWAGVDYEITTHRAEAYHPDSRKPDVAFSTDIEADLSRRDFTVNAMALEVTGDRAGADRPVRRPGRPGRQGAAHPARSRRVVLRRPAAHDAGRPVHGPVRPGAGPGAARGRWRSMADRLEIVSAERIRDELCKLVVVAGPLGRAVVPARHRPGRRVPAGAARPCGWSRTRSTATRTC